MDLSIIIVNWNTALFLIRCLHSIYKTTKKVDFEIFVVDNASKDNSVEMVRNKFPKIKLIANKGNRGFPKANNQAIKISQGEYILLLNPDTIVGEDTIDGCVEYLKKHPNVGALGVKIYNPDGSIDFHCARNLPTPIGLFLNSSRLNKLFPKSKYFSPILLNYWDHNDSQKIESISGAFMVVPRKVFNAIGLLDEGHFMYHEDTDLCFRIRKIGWDVYYLSSYSIVHFGGQSTVQIPVQSILYLYNAYRYFFEKHFGKWKVIEFRIIVFLSSLFKIVLISFGIMIIKSLKRKHALFSLKNLRRHFYLWKWSLQ